MSRAGFLSDMAAAFRCSIPPRARHRTQKRDYPNLQRRMRPRKHSRCACHDVAGIYLLPPYILAPALVDSSGQMWTAFGIMLGYIAGVVFRGVLQGDAQGCRFRDTPTPSQAKLLSTECSLNWRLMLASPMALPLVAAAYVYTLPESPRWLLLKARQGKTTYYAKAFRSLCSLRHSKLQAARDFFLIHHLLDGEEEIKQGRNRFFELWTVDRNRRALIASLTVMFLQQVCALKISGKQFIRISLLLVLRCKCNGFLLIGRSSAFTW